jgi:glycosyltransferase involved in cell wall biosynthesis
MKIAIISKADASGGGASKVAEDLSQGLQTHGHEVRHLVSWSSTGYGDTIRPAYGAREKLVRRLHGIARRAGLGELVGIEVGALLGALESFGPDIVHFHDTSGCFSTEAMNAVSRRYRTFWTFHDCSPFTGGCLYDMGCSRLATTCGECPRVGEWPIDGVLDRTKQRYETKHSMLESGRIRTIAPSTWMAEHAVVKGRLTSRPLVISNGVNVDTFQRGEQDVHLDAAAGMRIVLSAGSLSDSRKGIRHAVTVVRALSRRIPCIINLVGSPDPRIERELAGIPFSALGYVRGETAMARAYGTSDAFLLCSLADNQPLAVLEALSMGCVVGAYASGGVAGMIDDGRTGILSSPGRPDLLAQKLADAWTAGSFARIQAAARASAVDNYSMAAFLSRHDALYREALDAEDA